MKAISIFLIFLPSVVFCQVKTSVSDNNIPEDLLGTWTYEIQGEGETPSQLFKYTFREDGSNGGIYEYQTLVKWPQFNEYIAVDIMEGQVQVTDDVLTTSLIRVGQQQGDTIQWYYPGSLMYENTPKEEHYSFKLRSKKLILMKDENADGDYKDEEETMEYFRKI